MKMDVNISKCVVNKLHPYLRLKINQKYIKRDTSRDIFTNPPLARNQDIAK